MYLRNDRDRVNVCCVTELCQFYMTASAIKREETVCIRKMVLPHTCGITYDTSRVDSTWLSNRYEENFRSDPDWKISALIDTTKRNHGVDITPMMAYRARNKAADIVLGNHKQQYVRIRDWARHDMDTNCKTDLVVNNLSEVFNKYILETRDKPIQTMIDNIRTKLMVRYNSNREGLVNSNWEITRNYAEKLELEKTRAKHCRPVCAGQGLWQVTSGLKTYVVNVDANTCGCRRWDINGVPCKHAVSCIYKKKEHPEDYMSAFFKRAMYQVAYNNIIYPVPSKDSWTKTETPDIDPPTFTRHPGRPKKSRRKGVHEVPQPGSRHRMTTTTCSNCHKPGHKYTSCTTPLRVDLAIRKNKHKSNRRIFEEGPIHDQAEETPLHGQAEASPVHVQAEAAPVNGSGRGRGKGRGRGQAEAAIQDPFHAHAVFEAHDPFHGFDIQEVASQPAAANTREKLPVMRGSGSTGGRFMEYFTASGNH